MNQRDETAETKQASDSIKTAEQNVVPNRPDAFDNTDQVSDKILIKRLNVPFGFNYFRRLLTIPQAVDFSSESRATLYKEMKSGNLKFVKMGGSTRIEFDELNRYIDAKIRNLN